MFIYIYRFWPPVIFWLLFTALSFPSCSCFMFEEKEPSHQFRWLNILVISLIKRVPSPWDSLCHPQKEPMSPIGLQHTSTQMLPVSERRIVRWLSCHVEEHCSGWNLMKFAKTNDTCNYNHLKMKWISFWIAEWLHRINQRLSSMWIHKWLSRKETMADSTHADLPSKCSY